jgi:putative membrane protein
MAASISVMWIAAIVILNGVAILIAGVHPHRCGGVRHTRDATARWYSGRMKLLAKWLLSAVALLAVAHLSIGVEVKTLMAALIASLVIGLFNTLLRPILILLTLPVTVLTLGLFLFVINALMFWSAAGILDGFHVSGFGAALLGSLIYSVLGVVIDSALQRLFPR